MCTQVEVEHLKSRILEQRLAAQLYTLRAVFPNVSHRRNMHTNMHNEAAGRKMAIYPMRYHETTARH